jgi:hypothetical protein
MRKRSIGEGRLCLRVFMLGGRFCCDRRLLLKSAGDTQCAHDVLVVTLGLFKSLVVTKVAGWSRGTALEWLTACSYNFMYLRQTASHNTNTRAYLISIEADRGTPTGQRMGTAASETNFASYPGRAIHTIADQARYRRE